MTDLTGSAVDRRLTVWRDLTEVGILESDASGRLHFTYHEAVWDRPECAVSVRLPVRHAPYGDRDALPCFENLLPESDLRTVLAQSAHRSPNDVVGLLGVIGGECAGALTLWPEGVGPPDPPAYAPCTRATLERLFGGRAVSAATTASGPLPQRLARQSMSGVQAKIVLRRDPTVGDRDVTYRLPVNGAPGTVICKRDRLHYPGLVANEIASMSLMERAGVPTAPRTVNALHEAVYETARFDRLSQPDGRIRRLHAEDGCQLTGFVSINKYADPSGPTFQMLSAALNRYSGDAATDRERLLRWALANIVIGNRDAHAKNVSLLYDAQDTRRLAPAYDVVCTLAYPELDRTLPLALGGTRQVDAFNAHTPVVIAREFGLTAGFVREVLDDVVARIAGALDDVLQAVATQTGDQVTCDTLHRIVAVEAEALRTRCLD